MGFFDKFFGKKQATLPPPPVAAAGAAPAGSEAGTLDSSETEKTVKMFDKFGRELRLSKKDWLERVLLPNLELAWDSPDKLAGYIISGLQDGFAPELLKAAARLAEMDTNAERGTVLYSAVLLKSRLAGDAEHALTQYISRHGRSGIVLTNLAKVYAERVDDARVLKTLWEGLEMDPNQDNAVLWYEIMHREKSGGTAGQDALRRIAALPGSWRARLWLARAALQERMLEQALGLYQESLAHAPRPVPTDLLRQMSGDLGGQGHLPELLSLTMPHFLPEEHGLEVGNNLIKACLDLGLHDQAKSILDQLYAQRRPDWGEGLGFWDTELAKARLQTVAPPSDAELKMTLLTIEGPVWLKPDSPAVELFPARAEGGPSICFVGGSAEQVPKAKQNEQVLPDAVGRLTRALPLFLAEQAHWSSDVRSCVLLPWVVSPGPGFAVNGAAWADDEISHLARQTQTPYDYAVRVHLKAQTQPVQADLRLIRTIDAQCLGSVSAAVSLNVPGTAVLELAENLLKLIRQETGAEAAPVPEAYAIPAAADFPSYLLRLEQLLAVRCAGMEGVRDQFLSGEREILDGNLHLCLSYPGSLSVRLLFAQTLLTMKKSCPSAVAEFRDKARMLQEQHPLPAAAQGVVDRMINEAVALPERE